MKISSLIPLLLLTLSLQAHAFPDGFVENRGQWPADVRYRLQLDGLTMWITDRGAVYDLYERVAPAFAIPQFELFDAVDDRLTMMPDQPSRVRGHVLRAEFVGASDRAEAIGGETMSGRVNFFIGNDESRWGRNCRIYSSVRLKDLYEGIDAVYYLDDGLPRYDLIVAPGADVARTRMEIEGTDDVTIAGSGRLVIGTSLGDIEMRELTTYQINGKGERCQVTSRFARDGRSVSVDVGAHDARRPLIVDPLIYSTLIGGVTDDHARGFDVDAEGNVYLVGDVLHSATGPPRFPTTVGAYDTTAGGGHADIVVTKLDPSGSSLIYATYIGGTGHDFAGDIAVGPGGEVYVAGSTSPNGGIADGYPMVEGSYDVTPSGEYDIFATKLDASGSEIFYSTLLGGSGNDYLGGVALDGVGNLVLCGMADFPEGALERYPTTAGTISSEPLGQRDGFLTKLNARGSALLYSTFIGGSGTDEAMDIALDSAGHAFVVGKTQDGFKPPTFPTTPGVYGPYRIKSADLFLSKVAPDGSRLIYSTFIGGEQAEGGRRIAIDGDGNAYVTGSVYSYGSLLYRYPTTRGAYNTATSDREKGNDIFVTKVDPHGSDLIYSAMIGGSDYDEVYGIAVDIAGNAYIIGSTFDTGRTERAYPTTPLAFDGVHNGYDDVVVSVLDPTGSVLAYSTFIGGARDDLPCGIVVADDGTIYVAGTSERIDTLLPHYPITGQIPDTLSGSAHDIFVTRLELTLSSVGAQDRRHRTRIDLR